MLLIARAPLQLFQAVQTSILPHLTRLRRGRRDRPVPAQRERDADRHRRLRGLVALVMLAAGPGLMELVFGGDFDYDRGGLVLISAGMGLYLSAATLNQALLAHGRARQASCGAGSAPRPRFALFLLLADFDDRVLQVEIASPARRRCSARARAATRSTAAA